MMAMKERVVGNEVKRCAANEAPPCKGLVNRYAKINNEWLEGGCVKTGCPAANLPTHERCLSQRQTPSIINKQLIPFVLTFSQGKRVGMDVLHALLCENNLR